MDSDAPSSPPVARDWPLIGEVNLLECALGQRGEGKSAFQCQRVYESCREWGSAYVLGHSLGERLPDRLPRNVYGGAKLPIVYHQSIRKLDRAIRRDPSKWHILAPPTGAEAREAGVDLRLRDTADDLIKYAEDFALQVRRQAWWRAHPLWPYMPRNAKMAGLPAPPVIVMIDEGVAVQAAKKGATDRATGEHDWFHETLISLRHNHLAMFYAIQNPGLRSWKVLEQSTAIHVFHLHHEWALNDVRAAGATADQIAEISQLRRFEHVTVYPIRSEAPAGSGVDSGLGVRKPDEPVRKPDESAPVRKSDE